MVLMLRKEMIYLLRNVLRFSAFLRARLVKPHRRSLPLVSVATALSPPLWSAACRHSHLHVLMHS